MRSLVAALAFGGATLLGREALALDAPASEVERQWYGWQTLVVDASAMGATLLAFVDEDLGLVGVGAYALGPPVVHLAHGKPGTALASLGLRVGLPATGAFVGQFFTRTGEWGNGGAILGGFFGVIAAQVLDATVLAYEEVPVLASVQLVPSLTLRSDLAAFGVSGAF